MLVLQHAFIRIVLARTKHASVLPYIDPVYRLHRSRLSFTSEDGDPSDGVVLRETCIVQRVHRSGEDARRVLRAVGAWLGTDLHVQNGAHPRQHGVVGDLEVGWLGNANLKKYN